VRPVEIALSQHARRLPLAPTNQADLARTARPDPKVLRTSGAWAAYPQTGLLKGLLTLLATEPEPDKILAYLMQDLAEQIGADAMYLLRTSCDFATKGIGLA
jgi:hypothetical protein